MVLVIHGFWLWNDLTVVLDAVASVVLQIKSTTDSIDFLEDMDDRTLEPALDALESCSTASRVASDCPDHFVTSRVTGDTQLHTESHD